MNRPLIRYLVSSPYGDITISGDKLNLPLECDPLKTPYGRYFRAIETFLDRGAIDRLLKIVSEKAGRNVHRDETKEVEIRAEKHGALYHPASLELVLEDSKKKFGLNVAVSETGRSWLEKEFSVVQNINAKYGLPYLPQVYFFDECEGMSFLAEEWFEGYHEFHISSTGGREQMLKLWEFGVGYRSLAREQSYEIYRMASEILTLYYNIEDFCQIYPWHHAAGDFVAHVENNKVDVRLVTARQYDPYMVFREKEGLNPVIALFYFLLNLTIKMRLDKLDGVGKAVWAEDYCVEASVKGFRDGLRSKRELQKYFNSEAELFDLLRSFRPEDLVTACNPLVELYKGTADYPVITANLDRHVGKLYTTLQNLP